MLTVQKKELWPGVRLTAVHTDKFKSSLMSVTLLTPLGADTAALNALIPMVLRRGTRKYPDMEQINGALDQLYGGAISPMVRKNGETQCVGFLASVLDDAYALDGSDVLEPAAQLMGELLLDPCIKDGTFCAEYVKTERANLIDRIRGGINDKRHYSLQRLREEMCRDEAFGVARHGDEAHAAAITPELLWAQYQKLLNHARVELYYCGSAPLERVEAAYSKAFALLLSGEKEALPSCEVRASADELQLVEEAMDVTQGKLAMGFRTGGITLGSGDFPALMVFNALYGGSTTSKLFLNVREKLSLCYFANSALLKAKGILLVSSGIEFEKYEQAKDEILTQMEFCRQGKIEVWELEAARSYLLGAIKRILDSQGELEDHWLTQNAAGTDGDLEALSAEIAKVDLDRVVAVANGITLDTIYFLKGAQS